MDIQRFLTRKPEIYTIEINDVRVNTEMGKLIVRIEKEVTDLQEAIKSGDIIEKIQDSRELFSLFLDLKNDTNTLERDIRKIITMELQRKNYVLLRDDQFLSDKLTQLQVMQEHLDNLLEILKESPNNKEYASGLFDLMLKHLDKFIQSLERLKRDDQQLAKIYATLVGL